MAPEIPNQADTKMIFRNLGNSGLKVSALSYGAWVSFGTQIGLNEVKAIMAKCREHGVNFFDNAEVYSFQSGGQAEVLMGKAIKELGWERTDIVLSTKIFWGMRQQISVNDKGLSRKHVIEGTKAALKRLDTDYVDVIFCHRPDPETPIEETVRAFNYVIDQGWAYYWGTSEWSAQQITEAHAVAGRLGLIGPLMEQPEYNMFARERFEKEYAPLYKNFGLGTTIWSPLASGILTGKYSGGNAPKDSRLAMEKFQTMFEKKKTQIETTDKLKPIADSLGASLAQLAIAWVIKNPNVSTCILGATKTEQLEDNFKALDIYPKLTDDVINKIEAILNNKP